MMQHWIDYLDDYSSRKVLTVKQMHRHSDSR